MHYLICILLSPLGDNLQDMETPLLLRLTLYLYESGDTGASKHNTHKYMRQEAHVPPATMVFP